MDSFRKIVSEPHFVLRQNLCIFIYFWEILFLEDKLISGEDKIV